MRQWIFIGVAVLLFVLALLKVISNFRTPFLLPIESTQETSSAEAVSSLETSSASSVETLVPLTLTSPEGLNYVFFVEIADSADEQELGLMNRTSLAEDHGMLFEFSTSEPRAFWMKNTLIPLDIVYLDSEKHIVSMHTMQPCSADPCPTTPSAGAVQYALEIPAGRLQALGITSSWTASW
jgi:uncharacterized membrane protein (UPF0127 family)